MIKIIFIEGNVASGKSTAVNYLKEHYPDAIYLQEPVDHWQDLLTTTSTSSSSSSSPKSVNLLDAFYKDIPKYGFCFQTYAFLSRMRTLLDALQRAHKQQKSTIICERSIFTDREIFLEVLYENGQITEEERAVYHHLWDFWIGILKPYFTNTQIQFLYLRCQPEKALAHLTKRNRNEESQVKLEYLAQLHQKHQDLYYSQVSTTNNGSTTPSLIQTLIQNLSPSHQFEQAELEGTYPLPQVPIYVLDNSSTNTDIYHAQLDDWFATQKKI